MTVVSQPSRHELVEAMLAKAERELMSLPEVAQAMDVPVQTLRDWRNGSTPQSRHLRKIRDWLETGAPPS